MELDLRTSFQKTTGGPMLFKNRISPSTAAETVRRLEDRYKQAKANCDAFTARYGASLLDSETGSNQQFQKAIETARKDLDRAKVELSDIEAMLSDARTRHADALERQRQAEIDHSWDEVFEKAARKEQLAVEIPKLIEKLSAMCNEVVTLSAEQFQLAPAKDAPLDVSPLSSRHITTAIRQTMFRHGMSWAYRSPWGADSIPDFAEMIRDGNAWILKLRRVPNAQPTNAVQ